MKAREMERRQFLATVVVVILPWKDWKAPVSPVPGEMIPGRCQNRGRLIPRVKWACFGVIEDCPWKHLEGYAGQGVTLRIKKMWGKNHMIDHMKVKEGDSYMACATTVFPAMPKDGDKVMVTMEYYVTCRGQDQYAYKGRTYENDEY